MADGPSVQCTEDNSGDILNNFHPATDPLASLNPQEVQDLYSDATELVQKNKTKDEYINELRLEIHSLVRDNAILRRQLDESAHSTELLDQATDVKAQRNDTQVDRDLNQRILMENVRITNENKRLREMYTDLVKEKERLDHLALTCLHQHERINELEEMMAQADLKHRLMETDSLTSLKNTEAELMNSRAVIHELQDKLNALEGKEKPQTDGSFKADNESHSQQESDCGDHHSDHHCELQFEFPTSLQTLVMDEQQPKKQSSIHLKSQMSPPLKRGRFTMEKNFPFECSKCYGFFASKDEASKTTCSYHTKMPVPMSLRNNNNHSVSHDVFWPCCQKTGKLAVKCARGGAHKFHVGEDNT